MIDDKFLIGIQSKCESSSTIKLATLPPNSVFDSNYVSA